MENLSNLYDKACNAESAIKGLKNKNKTRLDILKKRAKEIGEKVLTNYPDKYNCISYSNEYETYASEIDSIAILDSDINLSGGFVSINTYSFGKASMIPLFWFTINFLWDELE